MSEKTRVERRNVQHPDMKRILSKLKQDNDDAEYRYNSARVIVESHTLWEHPDGRDLCDFDGEEWPCNTLGALGFIYGIEVHGW